MAEAKPSRRVVEFAGDEAHLLPDLAKRYPGGATVRLGPGEFVVDRTIRVPSNTEILGAGPARTQLVLAPGANCHLMSNADPVDGNRSIQLAGFSVHGNAASQQRPDGHRAVTYACGMHFTNVRSLRATDIVFDDIRQTALHLSCCEGVEALGIAASKVGWSGISTMSTTNAWIDAVVRDSGCDTMHSAFHVAGGFGLTLHAVAEDSTGNGIMLDSVNGPLRNVAVKGSATRCKRGIALVGAHDHAIENVLIEGRYSGNRETGVLISNASHVVLAHGEACDNGETGVCFGGERGGSNCLVSDFEVAGNPQDFHYAGGSKTNWVAHKPSTSRAQGSWLVNGRTLKQAFGKVHPWRLRDEA